MIDDGADGARAGARARCEIFFLFGFFLVHQRINNIYRCTNFIV